MHPIENLDADDFLNGQIILIDKPLKWTSFDVVKKIRYLLKKKYNFKKLKVGHAGTLDPLASGLLIICTGKFTKKITALTLENKTYTGTFTLGATTPSYDLETTPENFRPTENITSKMVLEAAKNLSGPMMQIPPIFSAKRVDGKRAYNAAREGKAIELKPHPVEVTRFETDSSNLPEVIFNIECTKGTYIRSLAHDFGVELGSGAYLSSLRRTKIGEFSVADSIEISDFELKINGKEM